MRSGRLQPSPFGRVTSHLMFRGISESELTNNENELKQSLPPVATAAKEPITAFLAFIEFRSPAAPGYYGAREPIPRVNLPTGAKLWGEGVFLPIIDNGTELNSKYPRDISSFNAGSAATGYLLSLPCEKGRFYPTETTLPSTSNV